MKYYLHRISYHSELSHRLLEDKNILSVGWSDFATRKFVGSHQATDWASVPSAIEQKWGKMRNRFVLQRFLQMNNRDRVVVPSWGTFHVYDVASDNRLIADDLDLSNLKTWGGHNVQREGGHLFYEGRKGRQWIDLGFFREVKQVERDIPRSGGYANKNLISRMKVRQTNVTIDDLREDVNAAIRRWQENNPINLSSLIMDKCAKKLLGLITENLTDDQLERMVKSYFERLGASVDRPAKNESGKKGDADIVATFEPIRTIIYAQVKCHEGVTDDWGVDQITRYVENKEELGGSDGYTRIPWVISTSCEFSSCCRDKAKQHQVHLIDGIELASRMLEVGLIERL